MKGNRRATLCTQYSSFGGDSCGVGRGCFNEKQLRSHKRIAALPAYVSRELSVVAERKLYSRGNVAIGIGRLRGIGKPCVPSFA